MSDRLARGAGVSRLGGGRFTEGNEGNEGGMGWLAREAAAGAEFSGWRRADGADVMPKAAPRTMKMKMKVEPPHVGSYIFREGWGEREASRVVSNAAPPAARVMFSTHTRREDGAGGRQRLYFCCFHCFY